jgi:hypothetical protein
MISFVNIFVNISRHKAGSRASSLFTLFNPTFFPSRE